MAVGRLTEAKNFANLIRAFAHLYQQQPNTRLIILGEGELRQELEQLRADLGLHDVVDLPGFDANPYAYFKYAAVCAEFKLGRFARCADSGASFKN
jgi:glycosyltransferase involved in cell wall biosynthesis